MSPQLALGRFDPAEFVRDRVPVMGDVLWKAPGGDVGVVHDVLMCWNARTDSSGLPAAIQGKLFAASPS